MINLNPIRKSKILNGVGAGISTPIAITIIVVLVVIIAGVALGYQYYWLSKQEAEAPKTETPVPKVETPKDETAGLSDEALATAGWKTYRNEEYGFEIEYPDAWIKTEHEWLEMVTFSELPPTNHSWGVKPYFTVEVFISSPPQYQGKSFSELAEDFAPRLASEVISKEFIQSKNKKEGYLFKRNYDYMALFQGINIESDLPYIVITFSPNIDKKLVNRISKNIIILKRLEDLDLKETINWKTYRNEEWGLEFKYPSEWKEMQLWKKSVNSVDGGVFGKRGEGDYHGIGLQISDKNKINDSIDRIGDHLSQRVQYEKEIKINNVNATKIIITTTYLSFWRSIVVTIEKDNVKYMVFPNNISENLFKQLYSTFKFID